MLNVPYLQSITLNESWAPLALIGVPSTLYWIGKIDDCNLLQQNIWSPHLFSAASIKCLQRWQFAEMAAALPLPTFPPRWHFAETALSSAWAALSRSLWESRRQQCFVKRCIRHAKALGARAMSVSYTPLHKNPTDDGILGDSWTGLKMASNPPSHLDFIPRVHRSNCPCQIRIFILKNKIKYSFDLSNSEPLQDSWIPVCLLTRVSILL